MVSRVCISARLRLPVRWFFLFLALPLFFASIASLAIAQAPMGVPTGAIFNGETATPLPGGHDYIHLAAETVNPSNGSVSINFDLPMPKGRGITLPYKVIYNSGGLYHLGLTPSDAMSFLPSDLHTVSYPWASWSISSYTPPQVTCPSSCTPPPPWGPCNVASGFNFTDPSGTSHNLGLGAVANAQGYTSTHYCPTTGFGSLGHVVSGNTDGKVLAGFMSSSQTLGALSNPTNGTIGPFTVTDEQGTTYFFDGSGMYDPNQQVYWETPYQIEDRNGNLITANTDTLGRPITGSASGAQVIGGLTYPVVTCPSCPSTTPVSYPVSVAPFFLTSQLQTGETLQCPAQPSTQVTGTQPAETIFALPTSTTANPQQYTSYYGKYNPVDSTLTNPYGLVNELVYPDGGWVKYWWNMSTAYANDTHTEMGAFSGMGAVSGTPDGNIYGGACLLYYSTPVLAKREVSFDGTNVAQTQTFSYSTTWGNGQTTYDWTAKQTQVTTTDNVTGASYLTVYNYGPMIVPSPDNLSWGAVASQIPVETSVLYYAGTSTATPLLRTVAKSWASIFDLAEEDATENGHTKKTTYSYIQTDNLTSPFTLLTGKSEYDFGATGVTRTTTVQYQTFTSNTLAFQLGTQQYSIPLPVPSQPSSVIVKNSAGISVAETDYAYDSYGTGGLASVTATQHDGTNYGAGLTNRANATSVTKKCISCTNAITTYKYDITGQPTSMTDPRGFATTYSFTDSPSGGNYAGNSNAYLTQVVYPKTGSTVHQESFQYNYVFGDLTQSSDENSQPTNYKYVDPFDRLTETDFPDTGKTTVQYTDSPTSPSVTTSRLITTSLTKTSTAFMDGMFHTKQTELVSDTSPDFVETGFDGLGRKRTVSNPHRSTSLPTDGTSTTAYDVLGRPITVTEPDGSKIQTAYDQTCAMNTGTLGTLVTDEAGNQRRSCTDGLGRLVEVDEPGGSVWGSAVPGTGSVTISGSEQGPVNSCPPNSCPIYDSGNVSVTVNGVTVGGAGFSSLSDTSASIAAVVTTNINNNANSPVTASAGGGNITLTAKSTGVGTDYSLSVSMTHNTTFFPNPSFTITASGADLTGGLNAGLNLVTPFVTLYNYDALDRLVCAEQHGSATSGTGCSSAPANDPSSPWRIRRFSYDSLSRLLSAENPETGSLAGTISYGYDANGNLTSKTALSPNQPSTGTAQVTTLYTYDALNRLTKKSYVDGYNVASATVQYGYDAVPLTGCATAPPALSPPPPTDYPIGQRTSMCDSSGATSWSHDPMGRVLEVSRTIGTVQGKFVKYTYNLDGSVASTTTSPLKTISYTYNGAGRMTAAKDNGDSINFVIGGNYTPSGALTAMTSGEVTSGFAGINTSIAYNNRLQPCWIYATTGAGLPTGTSCTGTVTTGNVLDLKYNFNLGSTDNGNVLSMTNNRGSARSQAFTYDALNRITSAGTFGVTPPTCWGYVYTVDAWGNLLAQAGWTPTYSNCSELIMSAVTADNHNRICSTCYDAPGNMTSYNSVSYTYDDENRLAVANGVFYYYDGDGNRVAKCNVNTCLTTTGTAGTFYWRGVDGETLVESNIAGTFQYEYVFFNGGRVAQRNLTTNIPNYYFADHLGSTSVVTDNNGNIKNESDYYPYGGEYVVSNAAPQNYKFNGMERDPESGLDNFGARFDASTIGRFMTPDWAAKPTAVPYAHYGNPQSLNLYAYAQNNPTTFGDPDGHVPWSVGGGVTDCSTGLQCEQVNQQEAAKDAREQTQAQNSDPTAPPPPPTPDPAGTRTDPALNPSNSNSNSSTTNTSADQTQAPMESRGQQPKGERNTTGKPEFRDKGDKLPKGVKPNPDKPGEFLVKDPHTGNWKPKPPGWSPFAQQVGIGAAIVGGAVITGHAIAGCFASGACEVGIAFAF